MRDSAIQYSTSNITVEDSYFGDEDYLGAYSRRKIGNTEYKKSRDVSGDGLLNDFGDEMKDGFNELLNDAPSQR